MKGSSSGGKKAKTEEAIKSQGDQEEEELGDLYYDEIDPNEGKGERRL